jgi:sarcosine oxidase subunit alpha
MSDLRISSLRRGKQINIRINGKRCPAHEGETVHASLLAAGFRTLRYTPKTHRPRGFFCGMGVCYDCLVTINGVPNRRACMTRVADGMEIVIDET